MRFVAQTGRKRTSSVSLLRGFPFKRRVSRPKRINTRSFERIFSYVWSAYHSTHRIVVLFSNPSKSLSSSRKHSSTVAASSSSSPTTTSTTNTTTRPLIQRHGPLDRVITLNVGGKQFQTLRSTISQNKVLYDHVLRAEAIRSMPVQVIAHRFRMLYFLIETRSTLI